MSRAPFIASISIDKSEVDKLEEVLSIIEKKLKKGSADIIRQAMIFAVFSAAKATIPSRASTPDKLPDKYLYRPIVKYQSETPLYINDDTGFTFESAKRPKGRNIRKITRAWEFWNKLKNKIDYKPYKGTSKAKYEKKSSFGQIPYAGMGKHGWLQAINRLPASKEGYSTPHRWRKINANGKGRSVNPIIVETVTGVMHDLMVKNVVTYVGKTSPNAANEGMKSARMRMIGSYKKKIAELEKYKV